jgi:hypothetical protein
MKGADYNGASRDPVANEKARRTGLLITTIEGTCFNHSMCRNRGDEGLNIVMVFLLVLGHSLLLCCHQRLLLAVFMCVVCLGHDLTPYID